MSIWGRIIGGASVFALGGPLGNILFVRWVLINKGYDEETVHWISRRVDLNEWKRGQAAPGLRVTSKAFGIGRRIPIAQNFRG